MVVVGGEEVVVSAGLESEEKIKFITNFSYIYIDCAGIWNSHTYTYTHTLLHTS